MHNLAPFFSLEIDIATPHEVPDCCQRLEYCPQERLRDWLSICSVNILCDDIVQIPVPTVLQVQTIFREVIVEYGSRLISYGSTVPAPVAELDEAVVRSEIPQSVHRFHFQWPQRRHISAKGIWKLRLAFFDRQALVQHVSSAKVG